MPFMRSLCVLLLMCSVVSAGDWPQWLGPKRDGSTSETIAPWKGRLKVSWKQSVGEGHSSPVVADGVVYLHYKAKNAEKEVLDAYDAKSGKRLWTANYTRPQYKGLFGNGPRATPSVAGNRVYTYGPTGILACFSAKKKRLLWKVDTIAQFQAPKLKFGASCSPLVTGGKVLINVGAKNASVVAFDAKTGDVVWKSQSDGASYASPILVGKGKKQQAIFFTGKGLIGLAPKDGTLYWRYSFRDFLNESSVTPVLVNDILVASAITRGGVGLKLDLDGKKSKATKKWGNVKLTGYFATPVPVGKYLYLVTGANPLAFKLTPEATLRCVNPKTGAELWNTPKVGKYHASLMRTGNNKLLLLEEQGHLVMLDPNPKGYTEICRSRICGKTWAHVAIADGRLFIRDGAELRCIALPK
ncbi:MAG: PQQ-binding-like beta-propeller repeat protein [Gemmataceae bacterium]